MSSFIFESAQVATPITVEENIKRGREAMKHVISSKAKEYRAMFRQGLGWIAFSWGEPGNAPPMFDSREQAVKWWASLKGKTNGQKGRNVFPGGRGVSHIIAKRDWEAKWMKRFAGQKGEEIAYKCVEVIAKGKIETVRQKKVITLGKMRVSLIADRAWEESEEIRKKGKKKEECWILTGYEVVENDKEYGIFESVGEAGGGSKPFCPTHTMPIIPRHSVGATKIFESDGETGGSSHPPRSTHPVLFDACIGMGATDSFESDGEIGSRVRQSYPTHTMPTVTRHGVGATDSLESNGETGSSGHLSHPTHAKPTASRHDVGASDSMEDNIPVSLIYVKPWKREEPEYGSASYGFSLNF